ncbi:MAG: class II glutamine amidotransferase [Rhodospirillales bacterium]
MVQSRQDGDGQDHGHGWGIATYAEDFPRVERQAWAAYHGEHFRRAAAQIFAPTVLAHVRRATIGAPGLANTHPFADGRWTFVHNGTVAAFDAVRRRMLAAMSDRHRTAIVGETDSEHVFRLLLTLHDAAPNRSIAETLRIGAKTVLGWCERAAPGAEVGFNVIFTDGKTLVGTRWGRTLYSLTRDGIEPCPICGRPHLRERPALPYRSVEVASEALTDEPWQEVPDRSLYMISPDVVLHVEPL